MKSTIECGYCGDELSAEIPLNELRADARNIGWVGLKCPACVSEEEGL